MQTDTRRGFYHPDVGYFEASHPPTAEHRANYPSGYVEVPVPLDHTQTFNPTTLLWEDDSAKALGYLEANDRFERDELLTKSDYIVTRHRDEVDSGQTTTLTTAKYQEWLTYRTALRNVTDDANWPLTVNTTTLTAPS